VPALEVGRSLALSSAVFIRARLAATYGAGYADHWMLDRALSAASPRRESVLARRTYGDS
jgi:hypothetical protein